VLTDFVPIALVAENPLLIVGRKMLPANDLKELIAWLKANPDKATEGTSGIGSASHVSGVFFQNVTGARFQFVPYRGAAPAMQDLVAGRIDLMIDQASNSLPHVRSDQIKAYAVTAKSRAAVAPEIPTVDEAGLPEFHISIWHALWAPKGTSKEIVAKLNEAVVNALTNANVRQRLVSLGQEIRPANQQTPEALAAFHKAEVDKWWPIVKTAGIKAE
jgi:tripartite-type tricarboxylate transporter receptor subunit TctC